MEYTDCFHLIIPGFGVPYQQEKRTFLIHNLAIIRTTLPVTTLLKVYVFNYSFDSVSLDLPALPVGIEITEVKEKGIVGQFIFRHMHPSKIRPEDTLMILLDDVTLHPEMNMSEFLSGLETYDIISPSLSHDSALSHGFMLQQVENAHKLAQECNFIELFSYTMKGTTFEKYYNLFDKNTAWCWGIDLCLHVQGFRLALCHKWPMKHYFKGISYGNGGPCPWYEMNQNIARYGRVYCMKNIDH